MPDEPRLSRQGGPGGDWLLRLPAELDVELDWDGHVVRLPEHVMEALVEDYRAIAEPRPFHIPRPDELPREYHVEIDGPRFGWWNYRITGQGLIDYADRNPSGLPRRSRAAALSAAQARIDRLAASTARRPERREIRPRCVP